MSMIRLEGVSKYYKSAETVSVGMKRINLGFDLGEFVAVTGESGSGKSTLLNVISGLDNYEEGELYLFGEETSHYTIQDWEKYRSTNIGFVFQNYNIIDSYTVLQNVLLALEVQGYDPKKRKQRALELIDKVGLTSHKNHKASKLSGGQKQRTVIARALAKDCPIIVADEPTGNLDSQSGAQVLKLLHEISKDKLIVVVTHDYDQVKPYATRKIKMHDGEVVEDKSYQKAIDNPIYQAPKHKKMNVLTLIRFTLRNLFSMPKRLVFLTLMQMIVMIAFTFVYTFRLSLMQDAQTAQSMRFPSTPETRVLVERRDGQDFTVDDLTYFENMRYVEKVYQNGLSFYNTSRLYPFFQYDSYNCNNGLCSYYTHNWRGYAGTDAAAMLNPNQVQGRLPESKYEIVVSHANWTTYNIGDVIYIGTSSDYQMASLDDFIGRFTIVGIDTTGSNILYFSDEFLDDPNIEKHTINYSLKNQLTDFITYGFNLNYGIDTYYVYRNESIADNDRFIMHLGEGFMDFVETRDVTLYGYFWSNIDRREIEMRVEIKDVDIYLGSESSGWGKYAMMNDAMYTFLYDEIMENYEYLYIKENREVVSLSVKGLSNGNRVLNLVDSNTYRVIYPANVPEQTGVQAFMIGLVTGIFMILSGLLLYSIVHAVSKNMMKTRKKDFAIYRSIGASKQSLAQLVVLEQVFIAGISSLLMLLTLFLIGENVASVYRIISYMEFNDYIYLITLFLLFGAWLGLRFNKRVFKQSVIESIVSSREE